MRRTLCFLALLAMARMAAGQATVTPNVGLQVPAYQQTNWQVPIDFDLNLLDGILGGTQTLTVGSATPVVSTFPIFITANTAPITITNFLGGFAGQKIVLICGSSDTFTTVANSANISVVSAWSCPGSLMLVNNNGIWTEISRRGFTGGIALVPTVLATSGANQLPPALSATLNAWNGSASIPSVWTLQPSTNGSGVPTFETFVLSNSGSLTTNLGLQIPNKLYILTIGGGSSVIQSTTTTMNVGFSLPNVSVPDTFAMLAATQTLTNKTVNFCATSQKTESAADSNILTCAIPASAGSYRIRFVMSVSAASAATLGWTATWTDSNGNTQTPTNLALTQSGVAAPALTFTTSAAGDYGGSFDVDVNNAGTSMVIKLTFSGTSFTAKVSATVEKIA